MKNIKKYIIPFVVVIAFIIVIINSSNNSNGKSVAGKNSNKLPGETGTTEKYNRKYGKQITKLQSVSSNSPIVIKNRYSISPKDNYIAPRWSPNGLDILYTGPKYKGLYIAAVDGTRVKKISDETGIGYSARWSSDGTKIITSKNGKITVYDITGDEVSDNKESFEDKPKVFVRDNNIYYRNYETQNEEKLTNSEDSFFGPKLSPDEKKVLYNGMVTGIYIRDLETGKVVHIGPGTDAQWSNDSKGIVFNFTQDDGKQVIASDLYYAYADGVNKYNITNTPDVIELKPQISPDGSKITFEVDGQIFVAELHGL